MTQTNVNVDHTPLLSAPEIVVSVIVEATEAVV